MQGKPDTAFLQKILGTLMFCLFLNPQFLYIYPIENVNVFCHVLLSLYNIIIIEN